MFSAAKVRIIFYIASDLPVYLSLFNSKSCTILFTQKSSFVYFCVQYSGHQDFRFSLMSRACRANSNSDTGRWQ